MKQYSGNTPEGVNGGGFFMRRAQRLKWIKTAMAGALLLASAASFADVVDDLIDGAFQNYPGIKSKQMTQKSAEKEVLAAKLNFFTGGDCFCSAGDTYLLW